MPDMPTCPDCGQVCEVAGPGELCPRCLMDRMMSDGPRSDDSTPISTNAETLEAPTVDGRMTGSAPVAPDSGETTLTRELVPSDRGATPLGVPDDPTDFGDYRIDGVLGRGGMGVVYLAWQRGLNRPVALKMIRRDIPIGEPELRRFRNESLAVAQLDHPGIVPIHEVDEFEGRPYFSMKRIEGGSLEKRLDPYVQDPRAAASLMVAIAEAVHHAHVRGILHRDLKPANILIDGDGRPVVTDFGLAKRIEGDDEQTQHGAILGTPGYMSPEQASGNPGAITTVSDVYGLGAVLYATLVGKAPFRESTALETLEAVRTRPPIPPRKREPGVPRDLETICLKCLEKEPKKRYPTAQALADDLRNWLDGRPISVRPAGPAERFGMWCRRNPAIAGLAAALLIAVVGGSAGIVVNWLDALHQRDLLVESDRKRDEQLRISQAINDLLTNGLLNYAYPTNRDLTVVELLDRIAPSIEQTYRAQPELEGPIRQVVGDAYRAQRRFDRAEEHLSRAVALARLLPPGSEIQRLDSQHKLAALRLDQGRLQEAEALARSAFLGHRRLLKEADPTTLYSANLLASVLKSRGQPEQAEALLRPYSATGRQAHGDLVHVTVLTDSNLGALALELGRFDEAETRIRDVLARLGRIVPVQKPLIVQARCNLGGTLSRTGRLAEAEAEYAAVLDLAREYLDEWSPTIVQFRNNLAAVILLRGRVDEVVQSLEDLGDGTVADFPELIEARNTLAVALVYREDYERAEPLFERIVRWNRQRSPGGNELGRSLVNLAATTAEQGRWGDAIGPASEAWAILERSTPRDDPRVAECGSLLGWCLLESGRLEEAAPILKGALDVRAADPSTQGWKLALTRSRYGGLLAEQGRREPAEPFIAGSVEAIDQDESIPPKKRGEILERAIRFYQNWPGREEKAEQLKALADR